MNWKTIGTWALGLAAVGGTAWFGYKIYKTYKEIYSHLDEVETLPSQPTEEEHNNMRDRMTRIDSTMLSRNLVAPLQQFWGYDLELLSDEAKDELIWISVDEETSDPEYFEEVVKINDKIIKDDIISAQEIEDQRELEEMTKKEVDIDMLRYDKDSIQAVEQYNEMMLADFDRGTDEWMVLRMLLDQPVLTGLQADEITANNILEQRMEFFGPDSKWIHVWTWGEVLLFYGTRAARDMPSKSYMDYVEDWVIDLNLDPDYPDNFDLEVTDLNSSARWFNGIYGLFSLDDRAVELHLMNYGFKSRQDLPLETQYQIWLASVMGI